MGDLNTGLGILVPVAMAGGLYPDASIGDPRLTFGCLVDRPGISIRHAAHCVCRVLVFASS